LNRLLLVLVLLPFGLLAPPAAAQEPPDTLPPRVQLDTVALQRAEPSPRGAFLRSLVLPGWGQLYVGAPRRAAVFITLQGTSYAMLAHSIRRLDAARQGEVRNVAAARDSILRLAEIDTAIARIIEDPDAFDELIAADRLVENTRNLIVARRRHRQDWIAYTIAFTMASAIDAYVAAHLSGFPAAITTEPRPDGGLSLGISVPVGRRP
jgi:hypothetical protein